MVNAKTPQLLAPSKDDSAKIPCYHFDSAMTSASGGLTEIPAKAIVSCYGILYYEVRFNRTLRG
jgi:hypothetical protein